MAVKTQDAEITLVLRTEQAEREGETLEKQLEDRRQRDEEQRRRRRERSQRDRDRPRGRVAAVPGGRGRVGRAANTLLAAFVAFQALETFGPLIGEGIKALPIPGAGVAGQAVLNLSKEVKVLKAQVTSMISAGKKTKDFARALKLVGPGVDVVDLFGEGGFFEQARRNELSQAELEITRDIITQAVDARVAGEILLKAGPLIAESIKRTVLEMVGLEGSKLGGMKKVMDKALQAAQN